MSATQKIIICGSQSSGKTTLSIKMAKMIEKKYKKTVVVVFAQDKGSPLTYAFSYPKDEGGCLGDLITRANCNRTELTETIVLPNYESDVAYLGYQAGKSFESYSDINREQVKHFYEEVGEIADYIIIDATTDFESNLITRVALERCDTVICVGSCDVQSMAYLKSAKPIINSIASAGITMTILNNVKGYIYESTIAEQLGGVDYIMPYDVHLMEQSLEGRMNKDIKVSKRKKNFNYMLENIIDEIIVNLDE